MHQRRAIREAVKAVLVAASTAAEDRVFESRALPWANHQLPAISVYSLDESVDPGSKATAPRELTRTLNLAIDCVVSTPANGAVDDALDDLAEQVEAAMHADPTLGGKAMDLVLASTTLGTLESGSRPMAAAQLVFAAEFSTFAPESADLEELEGATITHNLAGNVHPDNRAQDSLDNLDE